MKLLKPDPLAAARKVALETTKQVAAAEAKLIDAKANLEAAEKHRVAQTQLRETLRAQIKEFVRDGRIADAERLGRSVAEAGVAIETASVNAEIYGEMVDELERALIEAEQAAETAHRNLHSQAADEMRPELIELVQTKFRRAWRHDIAAGAMIPFDDWLHNLLRDAGSAANLNLDEPCDLGHPERPPQAECLNVTQRRVIRERLLQHHQAEQDAAATAQQKAEEAAAFAERVAANEAADAAAAAAADARRGA